MSQSKIESKELDDTPIKIPPTHQEEMDAPLGGSIEPANDSRLAEDSMETSHIFTKENDFHFDGEWLSSSVNQAGIEPINDFFSQSFELTDNDGTVPDISDQKLSSSTKGATFGIELPGETVTTSSTESRTPDLPENLPPNYQNYLVLNSEKNATI